MTTLIGFYPGDRSLDFLLVVTLGVSLVSSAAWLISRRLAGQAALRHVVLFSGLVCCLGFPAVAWFCTATDLTLISIPLLCGEQVGAPLGCEPMETGQAPLCLLPQPATNPPAAPGKLPAQHTNTSFFQCPDVAILSADEGSPEMVTPSAPEMPRTGSLMAAFLSFRGIATVLMFAWATGVLLLLLRLLRNIGCVLQLRRSSPLLEKEAHQRLLREVAARLGMRPVPLLLASSRTVVPLAVGFGRPAVILPEGLLGAFSDSELRDILLHEVAHLQRGDQRIVLLQELAGALFWPIVSVHALNRELQRAREELCDNVVLAVCDAISYGKTLLHVAELLVEARPLAAGVGITGGLGQLERRIAGLIDPRRNTRTATSRRVAGLVMVLFLAWSAIAAATRFAASASAVSAATETVAQVASPEEKAPTDANPDDPKRAGHFSGRVTGPDGRPLRGARVCITRFHGESSGPGPVRAETDADGRFAFDAPDMTYTELDGLAARREGMLIVTRDGYGPDWFRTWGQDTKGGEHWEPIKGAALNLQLARDDVPIHGRFLDPDGRPLAGARVRLTDLNIPRDRDLSAHLDRWSKAGVDAQFLTAIPDYKQYLWHRTELILGLAIETRTDADGRFTLSGLGRDRIAELRVSAPSVVDTTLTVMTRDGPDVGILRDFDGKPTQIIHGAGFTLQLKPGRTIKGRVIDRDSRAPIAGMWVGPLQNAVNELTSSLYPWVTDENGRFTITGLRPSRDKEVIVAVAAPGLPYQTAWVETRGDEEVLIECRHGIPFRLKLVDEQGRPVEAKVTYADVQPNDDRVRDEVTWPVSRAARKADGTYEGFVLPGPGAVLVKTRWALNYRPACVDPKAFFAPGRTNWTAEEQATAYGTLDTLITSLGRYHDTIYRGSTIDQRDYSAIVLVNPQPNSGPLQLSATVVRDRPRRVSLVDRDGKPIEGVQAWTPWNSSLWRRAGMPLRTASFTLPRLHPDRVTLLKFVKEENHLIGFLQAKGDSDTPCTVPMQTWATVTGRVVDKDGKPLADTFVSIQASGAASNIWVGATTDAQGRFRVQQVIPGLSYNAPRMNQGTLPLVPEAAATGKLVLRPGEVRDLGEVRVTPAAEEK